jgi:hypothetical protein
MVPAISSAVRRALFQFVDAFLVRDYAESKNTYQGVLMQNSFARAASAQAPTRNLFLPAETGWLCLRRLLCGSVAGFFDFAQMRVQALQVKSRKRWICIEGREPKRKRVGLGELLCKSNPVGCKESLVIIGFRPPPCDCLGLVQTDSYGMVVGGASIEVFLHTSGYARNDVNLRSPLLAANDQASAFGLATRNRTAATNACIAP